MVIYLLSIIIGCPGNAKILSNYDINKKDKTIILASSSYMGPLFILNMFSGMPKLFFISYYIANIFITIMFFKPLKLKVVNNYDNVFIKNVNILLQILGVIIFINIIYNLSNEIFNIPNIIYPFIEISLGSMYIDNMYVAMLALIFLGISIQFQIYNILKYNYFIFIIIKIIIGILALFLIYFFKYIIFIMLIMIICCIIKFRILFKKIRGNSYVCI